MTVSEIDAFLAAVRYGSLTEAARCQYTSQPTLSRRIHSLENELGYPLLIRGKGIRTVELTRQGEKFIQIAESWKRLWEDMQHINTCQEDHLLHFSAVNSLVSYIIYPAVYSFINKNSNIRVILESQHSYSSYTRVQEGILDGAFVCNTFYSRTLQAIPLWQEPMYLVAGPGVEACPHMLPADLDSSHEIRVPWNTEFEEWHDYWFGVQNNSRLIIDQMPAVQHLMLENPSLWMVAPISAARQIAKSANSRLLPLSSYPVRRISYISKQGYSSEAMMDFLKHLVRDISRIEEISVNADFLLRNEE